jgi:hypothetical protein
MASLPTPSHSQIEHFVGLVFLICKLRLNVKLTLIVSSTFDSSTNAVYYHMPSSKHFEHKALFVSTGIPTLALTAFRHENILKLGISKFTFFLYRKHVINRIASLLAIVYSILQQPAPMYPIDNTQEGQLPLSVPRHVPTSFLLHRYEVWFQLSI